MKQLITLSNHKENIIKRLFLSFVLHSISNDFANSGNIGDLLRKSALPFFVKSKVDIPFILNWYTVC